MTLSLRRLWSIYKRTGMAPASREAMFISVLGRTRWIELETSAASDG